MNVINCRETGKIELYYLKKIWFYYRNLGLSGQNAEQYKVEWNLVNAVFSLLGIGIEPTLQYLLRESPDFEMFEDWILKNGKISPGLIRHFNTIVSKQRLKNNKLSTESDVLSERDLQHWEKKGYVVIKEAIPKEDCKKTVELICKTIGVKPDDKNTWYNHHPLKQGIMIQLFQNEILDKNRLSSKIRKAYEQLWQQHDLLVSMDRVSFNPPETKTYQFSGPHLHWDVSLKQPIPFGLQGLLYLSDTKEDQGAFTVIPEFHHKIDSWLNNLPKGKNPRDTELLQNFKQEPIAGEAGDFIIWNHCLPHGSSPNTSDKPRIVQYINYQPIDLKFQEEWI